MRGVTGYRLFDLPHFYISIHTPHARRDIIGTILCNFLIISIHTPHARRDNCIGSRASKQEISIHTPHARRDLQLLDMWRNGELFQSTRLMRGVTYDPDSYSLALLISIHTPHARRDFRVSTN